MRTDFAQLRRLPDLLFPRRCPFCGSLLGPDALQGTVCPACVPEEMRLQHIPARLPEGEHDFYAVREAAAGSELMEDISGIMRQRYAFGSDFATSRVSQKNNRTMKNTGIVIASLVGGMILGSALTMLLTPQSGPELRRQIKDFVDEEINRAKQKAAKAQEKVQEKMQEEIDELRVKSAK